MLDKYDQGLELEAERISKFIHKSKFPTISAKFFIVVLMNNLDLSDDETIGLLENAKLDCFRLNHELMNQRIADREDKNE